MVFKDNKMEQIKEKKMEKKKYVYIRSLIRRHANVNLPKAFPYETLCEE